MSEKFALIIGNTEYIDPGLPQLTAPENDAKDLERVLGDKGICAFDQVNILLNQPEYLIREAIYDLFNQKKPDDLLLLYFSGHGVKDEYGTLHLAVKNTNISKLGATAIDSNYIAKSMEKSRSKSQLLILDCCNSGAFSQGTKAPIGMSMGTATAFEAGSGRIILTASDAMQFAWEGDKILGHATNSLFTHFLVEGLKGEADLNSDGYITVDELYDYVFEKTRSATPKQTPSKFSSQQQGEIVLRQIMRIEDINPVPLPEELVEAIDDSRVFVREDAVHQLEKLLKGRNLGLARSARKELERTEKEDDSRRVSYAATQALKAVRQAEEAARQKEEELQTLANNNGQEQDKPLVLDPGIPQDAEVANAQQPHLEIPPTVLSPIEGPGLEPHAQGTGTVRQATVPKAYTVDFDKILQKIKIIFDSVSRGRASKIMLVTAAAFLALLLIVRISFPPFLYSISNSASERQTLAGSPQVEILGSSNFDANKAFLNGIDLKLEVRTSPQLKKQQSEVVVYVRRLNGENLPASRTFTDILSPYIAKGNVVSVYTDFTPTYDYSFWNVKLFLPYAAIGVSDLPGGTVTLELYAELHNKADNQFIARSEFFPFEYTKP